jgi:glucose/arabinose dehydrogenase
MKALIGIFLSLFTACAAEAADPQLVLRPVATGLNQPVAITNAGDERLFITLQPGEVVIRDAAGNILPQPFLDLRTKVSCCGEQGLLSIAFHPHYKENGFFYVDYTNTDGNTVVARYAVAADDPNRANMATETILLTIDQPFDNHNGGQLQFGPDGYLYIGMGDGGSADDPGNRGQNLSVLLGKLLRIDVDHSSPYALPATNPFVSTAGARGEIWAYGLRNPWRFSFDRLTGDLWIGDVGQSAWEEVDLQPAGSAGGQNYGWRKMEGKHCFNPSTNCQDGSLTLPILEYSHTDGCSITGGYRYRGSRLTQLRGTYFYADYCEGTIWGGTQLANGSWSSRVLLDTNMLISTFGEDVNGELYLADLAHGIVYSVVDDAPQAVHRRVAGH